MNSEDFDLAVRVRARMEEKNREECLLSREDS